MHVDGPILEGPIERLIAFSARNRFFTIAVTAFLCMLAWNSLQRIPLDAIPDISDTQVIIYTKWPGRPPNIIEDQVTYPIVTALMAAPKVRAVRGTTDFGYSYVYVIFEDGTDIYWARSRVLEYLAKIQGQLPPEATPELGPDASAVGWIFQYALVDRTHRHDLADLRTLQDWNIRFALQSVEGVSEVATVGGFEKQYVIEVQPERLRAYGVTVDEIITRVRAANNDVGGRSVEWSGREYMVWGRGYITGKEDIAQVAIRTTTAGTPIRVGDVANVVIAPNMRRGVADLNGQGEVVGGVVLMRYGENALTVIDRVKRRIDEIRPSLPQGVEIVTVYDRSTLIQEAIGTLKHSLIEEMLVVSLVIIVFLLHIPSALIPIITIPVAVLLSFLPMQMAGVTSNIMSLGGIAVAIGALVDAAIVVVENSHKRIEEWEERGKPGAFEDVLIRAIQEVGRPAFFSLLILSVSFLPVFGLTGQEGRLFAPLAITKTLAMALAAALAITLDPAVRLLFVRNRPFTTRSRLGRPLAAFANTVLIGKIHKEDEHPISRVLSRIYHPICAFSLRWPKAVIAGAVAVVAVTVPIYFQIGKEFMPPLQEGAILYMPTTVPGLSVTEASRILQIQDRLIRTVPEVRTVFGKAGRYESSTDPAPFSMVETVIELKPEHEWRTRERWYSSWAPEWLKSRLLRAFWPDRMTMDEIVAELEQKVQLKGWQNAFTMPIRTRIDMLATGVRTPVGIKVMGGDLRVIEQLGLRIEEATKGISGTRSVFAERVTGGYFLRITPKREALGRYGISLEDVLMQIESSIGGMEFDRTIEGRERYTIAVRYARELRSDLDSIRRVLVPVGPRIARPAEAEQAIADRNLIGPSATENSRMAGSEMEEGSSGGAMASLPASGLGGTQIPLGQIAEVEMVEGPAMIRDEDGLLTAYVLIDFKDRDMGSYVEELKAVIDREVMPHVPAGYRLEYTGQYEYQVRANQRLAVLVPLTLGLIFILLYLNTGSMMKTAIVFLALPFSAVGAIWLLWGLDYNLSVAVWVGLIALLGVDAETGIFMLLYLDLAWQEARREGRLKTTADLQEAIVHGAVRRLRPKFMTVTTTFIGLLPIMWSSGVGADVMKRVAAPMVGGLATSFLMELVVYPAVYLVWKKRELPRGEAGLPE